MTPRERILAVLERRVPDRVPIWLLFPYHPLGCYVNVLEHPAYRPVHEKSLEKGVVLDRRSVGASLFGPGVSDRSETLSENGQTVRRRIVEYKGRKLIAESVTGQDGSTVKKLLENEDDLDFFASLPFNVDERKICAELEPQLAKLQVEKREFPSDAGLFMLDVGEPIQQIYGNSDLEEYAVWSITAADTVKTLLDKLMRRYRITYRHCLERNAADVYFLVGSELASPPLLSRTTFRQWIVPYAGELIETIHRSGSLAIQHYHGQIGEILPDFLEMNPDALHTIEAPPVGDCTLTQAYEVVGDKIALIGNVQYDCFRSYTPEQIRTAVHEVLDECRGRRFILSPTAGPFDENPSQRLIENYMAFLDAGWELGGIR